MKKFVPIFFCCHCLGLLFGQNATQRAVVELMPAQFGQAEMKLENGSAWFKKSPLLDVPIKNAEPFLAVSFTWEAENWDEENRFFAVFHNGGKASTPIRIVEDEHAEQAGGKHTSQLVFIESSCEKFELEYDGNSRIENIEVHFFNPGKSVPVAPDRPEELLARSECTCEQPAYSKRSNWCPAGNCPPNPSPSPTNVTHLIIHHSAGPNVSSDWAAVVRSFWDFHVNVNGWSDIGYNWLVDPNGVLYEGRGDGILGAHFCGKNTGTMGVCVIGDFTNIAPAQAALDKLKELLSWKACDVGLDPLGFAFHNSSGLVLKNISGHRDGCSTSCPGDTFYPMLPSVRSGVKDWIENVCQNVTGLEDETGVADEIRIFPNPAVNELFVETEGQWEGGVQASVYDVYGKLAVPGILASTQNGLRLGVGHLSAGVYWLVLKQPSGARVFKVIKN